MKAIKRTIVNKNNLILLLLLFGFIIRIDFALRIPADKLVIGDAVSYNSMAENFIMGNGLVNTKGEVPVLAPVFPLFLSLLYLIFGNNYLIIQISIILINLATVFVGYLVAKKFLNNRIAIWVLVMGIFYPFFIYWSRYFLTDILFAFLNICILFLIVYDKKEGIGKFAILGVLIGITTLERGTSLFLPFAIFVYYWIKYDFKLGIKFLLISLFIISLLIFLWGVYNYKEHKQFVVVASYGGVSLYMGNNPNSMPDRLHYSSNKCYEDKFIDSLEGKDFFTKDKLCKRRAIKYILGHPFIFIKNTLIKMKVYWKEQSYSNMISIPILKFLNPIIKYMDSFSLFLAIIGIIVSIKEYKRYLLLYIFIFYYTFMCSIFLITEFARFRLPVMVLVFIFSVKGIDSLYNSFVKLKNKL